MAGEGPAKGEGARVRIAYFHQYFSTPAGSTGTRSYEMARRMVLRGHSVTVICGRLPDGVPLQQTDYVRGRRLNHLDGIDVIELDLQSNNRDSFSKRTWTFVRFCLRSIKEALTLDYDVIFATSTPLTVAIPGIAAKLLRGKTFVFEVRDLWPELPRAMGVIRNPLVLWLMGGIERAAYACADGLVGLAPGISRGLARFGKPLDRIVTVPNGCDLDDFGRNGPGWRPEAIADARFLAVFSGTMGLANRVEAALDAAALLKQRGRTDIHILLVGDGRQRDAMAERVAQEGLTNVTIHPQVPKTQIHGLLRSADVGLQLLANVPAFYYGTSPNKFFDYIASGLPVLTNYPGWLGDLINENRCGAVVEPDNPGAFADALMRLADDREELRRMGERARTLAEREFSRSDLAAKLIDFLEKLYQEESVRRRTRGARSWIKRMLDIMGASLALVLLSPLLLVLAVVVRMQLGSPVVFAQQRPGRSGRPFRLYKFRTMTDARAPDGSLLPDSDRLTPFGRWLRSSSLDELPELWNVLRGEMSLVGPRPLLTQYLPLYSPRQALRHDVRPGITGWAQINGRNDLSWNAKFELDVWYVENWSLRLDLLILCRTLWTVARRHGINATGDATMPIFTGSGVNRGTPKAIGDKRP